MKRIKVHASVTKVTPLRAFITKGFEIVSDSTLIFGELKFAIVKYSIPMLLKGLHL